MRRIGVLYNPLSEESITVSLDVAKWLQQRGLDVWRGISQEGREQLEDVAGLDLLIALGGDGTVLRAARLSIMCNGCNSVPVLAVALGHLSFMSEIQPEHLYDGLTTLLEGGGWRDERTLIEAGVYSRGRQIKHVVALNEVLVAHGEPNRTMTVDVDIYGTTMASYHADGVIVATATGSTAYALAAGGPIVDPRSQAMVLVPIAAHLTQIPSLVLQEDAVIRLRVRGRYHALFVADGRENTPLQEDDVVEVRRSEQTCVFAHVYPPSEFYARMVQRLRPRA
jgi:NAD+ kinase